MNRVLAPKVVAAVVLALLCFVGVSSASAALVQVGQIFLATTGTGSLGGTCGPNPYCPGAYADIFAELTDANHVTFLFSGDTASLNGTNYQYLFAGAGGNNLVGLTLNATSTAITAGSFSYTNIFGNAGTLSAIFGGSDKACGSYAGQHVDGVGCYNLTIEGQNGGTANAVDDIKFTLTLAAGDTWGCVIGCGTDSVIQTTLNNQDWLNSISGVFPFNSNSWAEAHISTCSPDASAQSNCGTWSPTNLNGPPTAWAGGAATTTQTPEPGTLALLGTGLVLIGTLGRRFKK